MDGAGMAVVEGTGCQRTDFSKQVAGILISGMGYL